MEISPITNADSPATTSMDETSRASDNASLTDVRTIFYPPNSLKGLAASKLSTFLGCSLCIVTLLWFAISVALYPSIKEYHAGVNMFEARWIPSTMGIAGVLCVILKWYKFECIFLGCAMASFYSVSSSAVTIVVYSFNLNRSITSDHFPMNQTTASPQARHRYIQLCASMIVATCFGLLLICLLLRYLHNVAVWYYKSVLIPQRQWLYLFISGKVQICLLLFSIYVTSRIIAMPFSYVHTYTVQELLCSLIMLSMSILQIYASFRSNELILKLVLVLAMCQFFQEIFYAWNSYYISLYIHSNKIKLAVDVGYDQAIMTANFIAHFVRMCLSAYTTYVLVDVLSIPFVDNICKLDLNRRVLQSIVATSAFMLVLASGHVILDIVYAASAHVYRNFIAFTGISVFYLVLIGVNLSFFLRHRNVVFLINASLFILLLIVVSFHSIFIYLAATFRMIIAVHYETMKRDFWQPARLHFTEACLSFVAALISLIGGCVVIRLLHIDSGSDKRYGTTLHRPMLVLFILGWVLLASTIIETFVISAVKGDTSLVDSTLDYGILDLISMYTLACLQIYVTNPYNCNISYPIITLFLFLLCETLTTYHYLNTFTIYAQTMMILGELVGTRTSFMSLVTPFQVKILLVNYTIQLIQWVLTIGSLFVCAVVVEMLHSQRMDLAKPTASQWSTTDAANDQVRVCSVSSEQPRISFITRADDLKNHRNHQQHVNA